MRPVDAVNMKSQRWTTVESPVTLLIVDAGAALGRAPDDIREDLERRLPRADAVRALPGGAIRTLFRLFGFEAGDELPAAAVTRSVDAGDAAAGTWLRADPAWMDVGSALVLKGWGDPGLDPAAGQALAEALAETFAAAGLDFSAPTPGRWYLRLGDDERVATTPPDELAGRDAGDHLPEGDRSPLWRRLMNECQMVLHNHPVNRDRRAAGQPPVNSLWFWGSGALPGHAPRGFSRVTGGGALVRGLAALPGGTRDGAGTLLIADGSETDREVWEDWRSARPASARVLVPETRRRFEWRRRHGFRVWRGRRELESLLAPRGGLE